MKRRYFIDRLSQENSLPERLEPESIKTMLEDFGTAGPVIGLTEAKSEVRIKNRRTGVLKSIAAAVIFVLAAGSLAVLDLKRKKESFDEVRSEPAPTVQTADCTGLEGLRGGNYKALYNFLSSIDTEPYKIRNSVTDDTYAYYPDEELEKNGCSDQVTARNMRQTVGSGRARENGMDSEDVYSRMFVSGSTLDSSSTLFADGGDVVFSAASCGVSAYVLEDGDARETELLFPEDTFLATLSGNALFEERGHTLKPYVTGIELRGSRLFVFYGFHLPERPEGQQAVIMQEYCGVCVFETKDVDNISLIYEYEQPGALLDHSFCGDGSLKLMSQYAGGRRSAEAHGFDSETLGFLPRSFENGEEYLIPEDKIYLANREGSDSLIYVSRIEAAEGSLSLAGQTVLTAEPESYAVTDDGYLLYCYYYSYSVDDQSLGQLINIDTKNETEITAARYTDGQKLLPVSQLMRSFAERDGYYLLGSYNMIFVIDKELQFVCSQEAEELEIDYNSENSDTYFSDAAMVFDGDRAFFSETFEVTRESRFYSFTLCTAAFDISDPENIVPISEDPPVLDITRDDQLTQLPEDGRLVRIDMETGELILLSNDPADAETTVQRLGKTETEIPVPAELSRTETGLVSYEQGEYFREYSRIEQPEDGSCLTDKESGLIFFPVCDTRTEWHRISKDEFEELDHRYVGRLIYSYDEQGRLSDTGLIDKNTLTCSVLAVRPDGDSLKIAGLYPVTSQEVTDEESGPIITGALERNGYIYVFYSSGKAVCAAEEQ
ncbi:MAG: beta-propeller domain-containing protein [Ruminococcus sp.]|nr:beta-propeller domain-containing protein [Ruminococcus sp.]